MINLFLSVFRHPLLDPSRSLSSVLLRLLLVLENIPDGVAVRHMPPLLDGGPAQHALLPRLEMGELVEVDARPAGGRHPPPVRDVRDGDVVADQVPGLGGGEVLVQDAVEAPRLVDVAVDAVLDALGRVAVEVVRLALHGPHARVLEEQPVGHLVVLARASRVGDLVVLVVLVDQVLEDASGLEDADLLAVGERVRDRGDASVGVDFKEPSSTYDPSLACPFPYSR